MDTIIAFYESLGIDLNDFNHPISQFISLAKEKTGIEEKQIKQKLRILGLALMDIKDYKQSIYDFYLKKTVKNADFSVNGYIFEIIQCANLIRTSKEKKLHFQFGDHAKKEPDLIIDGCGIEITSIRFSEESQKNNADSKLINKFREKNKKDYANSNSLLLIETTQPIHFANNNKYKPNTEFNKTLKKISLESNFGIVLCYIEYTVPTEENVLFKGTVYTAYGKDCTENLKNLFLKITNGEFNTFDGTQTISKY